MSGHYFDITLRSVLEDLSTSLVIDPLIDSLLCRNPVIVESKRWWSKSVSDQLFTPVRVFTQRSRARKFLRWVISHGVDAQPWLDQIESGISPLTLGPPTSAGGGVGVAYMISDKVVKITPDKKEAAVANVLLGKEIPNLTKFYAVGELTRFSSRPSDNQEMSFYAIISDRVPQKIPGKYRIAANAVYNYLDDNPGPIVDVQDALIKILNDEELLAPKYRQDVNVRSGIIKILKATDSIYKATGVLLQDPHGGNVLMRNGDVQFFDVGRSTAVTGDQPLHKVFKEWDDVSDRVTSNDVLDFMRYIYSDGGHEFLGPETLIDSGFSHTHRAVIYSSDDDFAYVGDLNGYHEDVMHEARGRTTADDASTPGHKTLHHLRTVNRLRAIYNVLEGPLGFTRGAVARIGYGINSDYFKLVRKAPTESLPSPRNLTLGWRQALARTKVLVIRGQENTNNDDIQGCVSAMIRNKHIDDKTLVFVNCNKRSSRIIFIAGSIPLASRKNETESQKVSVAPQSVVPSSRPYIYKTIGDGRCRFERMLDMVLEAKT